MAETSSATALDRLWQVIQSRRGADPQTSYTARLFARGRAKIAQKLGEEAVETVIEGVRGDRRRWSAKAPICSITCWCCGPLPASAPQTSPPNWPAAKALPASRRRKTANNSRVAA